MTADRVGHALLVVAWGCVTGVILGAVSMALLLRTFEPRLRSCRVGVALGVGVLVALGLVVHLFGLATAA